VTFSTKQFPTRHRESGIAWKSRTARVESPPRSARYADAAAPKYRPTAVDLETGSPAAMEASLGASTALSQGIAALKKAWEHELLFSGPFAGSTSTSEVRRTVFLDRDARMVDLDVTLTGFAGPLPGLPEVEPGVVRVRVKWIVVRRESGWKILAQQITARAPTP
jgi:hypothetical protein